MKSLFTSLFLLYSVIAHSQSFAVETIGTIKDKVSISDAVLFKDHVYAVETEGKAKLGWTLTVDKVRVGCKIFQYDKNMNLINDNELANGDDIYGPFPPFLKVINNQLYLITYDYNTTEGIVVSIAKIDSGTLVVSESKKLLTVAQKNVGLFKIMSLVNSYSLMIESSPDSSKILFLWNAGVNNYLSYAVTDSNLNILKNGTQQVENAEDLAMNSVYIDNGGAFFSAYTTSKKFKNVAGILAVSKEGNLKTATVDIGDWEAKSACIVAGANESQIKIAGAARSDDFYVVGAYSLVMDKKNLNSSKLKTKEMPQEMVEKFHDDGFAKAKKKKNGLYPDFEFMSFLLPGGSTILAADLTRYQNMGKNGTTVQPIKGSTFIVIISASGDIQFKRLPKRETYGGAAYNSFFAHQLNDKVILFYTDTRENAYATLEEGKSEMFTSRKDNTMVAAMINSNGDITRRLLNPPSADSFYFSPDNTSKVDDHTLLLGLGKDKTTLTRIKTTHLFYRVNISDN